ncbi:MAG: hypothetical protein LLG01_17500 [Planctomycetaceae bacterium]|nr:hypothetical protein [Planctomycetaceae bacterium]
MTSLFLVVMLSAAAPAAESQPAAKPIEEVLPNEKAPNGKKVMVTTRILIEKVDAKSFKVTFIDASKKFSVNIKKWKPGLTDVKPGCIVNVTGELHYGACKGGTQSIRYKVKEVSGRTYNDHRHWRTDQAIYIINPTYTITPPEAAKEAMKK